MSHSGRPTPWPMIYYFYLLLSFLAAPLLRRAAKKRHASMGGDPARLNERLGHATAPRPDGHVIWINAASLGELRAALPVIHARPNVKFIVTTTSVSAANLAADLPSHVQHQFAPLDLASDTDRFLAHWQPDMVLFMESELPLRAITRLGAQGVPMANLNARPSSTRRRLPGLARAVLSRLSFATAQDNATAAELRTLGLPADHLTNIVDLKSLAPPPAVDASTVATLKGRINNRPVWLVMSAHPAEYAVIAQAQRAVQQQRPDALLILAPRHPATAPEAVRALEGCNVGLRSKGDDLGRAHAYVADTLGEAGSLYHLASFAVIGGSFADIGGHSPYEALKLGKPVITGSAPGVHRAAYEAAIALGAAVQCPDAATLADQVLSWMDQEKRAPAVAAAQGFAAQGDDTLTALLARMDLEVPHAQRRPTE